MKLEQFIGIIITVLLMILVTAWIYLGHRLYRAVKKRRIEKRYVIVTDACSHSQTLHRHYLKSAKPASTSPMPDLTDTDVSSTEDDSDGDTSEEESRESTKVIIVDP